MLLSDTNGDSYTLISDTTAKNAGLSGGELRSILVEPFGREGRPQFISESHFARLVPIT